MFGKYLSAVYLHTEHRQKCVQNFFHQAVWIFWRVLGKQTILIIYKAKGGICVGICPLWYFLVIMDRNILFRITGIFRGGHIPSLFHIISCIRCTRLWAPSRLRLLNFKFKICLLSVGSKSFVIQVVFKKLSYLWESL